MSPAIPTQYTRARPRCSRSALGSRGHRRGTQTKKRTTWAGTSADRRILPRQNCCRLWSIDPRPGLLGNNCRPVLRMRRRRPGLWQRRPRCRVHGPPGPQLRPYSANPSLGLRQRRYLRRHTSGRDHRRPPAGSWPVPPQVRMPPRGSPAPRPRKTARSSGCKVGGRGTKARRSSAILCSLRGDPARPAEKS
jgi:hypothetical protein